MTNAERNARIIHAVRDKAKTFLEVATEMGLTVNVVSGVCKRAGVKAEWTPRKKRLVRARLSLLREKEWADPATRKRRMAGIWKSKREARDGELQSRHGRGAAGRGLAAARTNW